MDNNQFWKLSSKFRKYYINGFSDNIDESKYDEEYWNFFIEMLFNVISNKNYLCFKILSLFDVVSEEDVFNRFFLICHIKKDYELFSSDPDKMAQSYPVMLYCKANTNLGFAKLIPRKYYEKIRESINLTSLTSEINICDEGKLQQMFPKSYKKSRNLLIYWND
jgi:hypothetical protein